MGICSHEKAEKLFLARTITAGIPQKLVVTKLKSAQLFIKHVESMLRNEKSKYRKLIDLILQLRSVSKEIEELLKGYPSLISGFNTFIRRHDLQRKRKKRSLVLPDSNIVTNKCMRRSQSANHNTTTLQHRSVDDEVTAIMPDSDEMQKELNRDKSERCPLNQIVCTPSYYILPDACNSLPSSEKANDNSHLLNRSCALVKKDFDDSCIAHRNQHEENLFILEEDRYELDMLESSIRSTIWKVESALSIQEDRPNRMDFVCKHFTAQQLKCIEMLYGDHGIEVVELMKGGETPLKDTLSVILPRLQQKMEMISEYRPTFERIWAKAFAENQQKLETPL